MACQTFYGTRVRTELVTSTETGFTTVSPSSRLLSDLLAHLSVQSIQPPTTSTITSTNVRSVCADCPPLPSISCEPVCVTTTDIDVETQTIPVRAPLALRRAERMTKHTGHDHHGADGQCGHRNAALNSDNAHSDDLCRTTSTCPDIHLDLYAASGLYERLQRGTETIVKRSAFHLLFRRRRHYDARERRNGFGDVAGASLGTDGRCDAIRTVDAGGRDSRRNFGRCGSRGVDCLGLAGLFEAERTVGLLGRGQR